MKKTICLLFTLLLFSNSAKSDPGPVVNWLMKEPASLHDIGMLRTELNILITTRTIMTEEVVFFTYDWNTNRFQLTGVNTNEAKAFSKDECKNKLNAMRLHIGGVNYGKTLNDESFISANFSHRGYKKTSHPKDYKSKLDQIISVIYRYRTKASCSGPLVSTKVLYELP